MAKDVTTFLAWAAEPEMEERKVYKIMTYFVSPSFFFVKINPHIHIFKQLLGLKVIALLILGSLGTAYHKRYFQLLFQPHFFFINKCFFI